MTCLSCARGFFFECGHTPPQQNTETLTHDTSTNEEISASPKKLGRPFKDDSEITTSAGRKRAAELYPILEDSPCEWQGLANCGGGKSPILGCFKGKQVHRHHGPVKDTSHNERTNIHLICPRCHNTWHARNDPLYNEEEYASLPHEPHERTNYDVIQWINSGGKLD